MAHDASPARRTPWAAWSTWGATALAAVTATLFLGRKPFWLDEGYSFVGAHRPLPDLARLLTHDENNMGPYLLALHYWLALGRSEAVVRLLSAAAAVATVPLLCALARRLYDDRTAAVVGVLAALDAMLVQYAQEARAYSWLVLITTASTLLLVQLVARPRVRSAGAWVAVSALAVSLHYFGALVVVAQLASLVVLRPPRATVRLLAGAVAAWVLLLAPLLWFVGARGTSQLSSAERFSVVAPARLWARVFGSVPLAVVAAALLVHAAARLLPRLRQAPRSEQSWHEALPWSLLVVPPALTLALSVVQPVWRDRYLVLVVPAALLLLARALVLLRARLVALGLVVVLMLAALASYYRPVTKQGTDWRAATAVVAAQQRPGDATWFLPGTGYVPALYYAWKRSRQLPPDLGLGPAGLRGRLHPAAAAPALVATRAARYRRVWVVLLATTGARARRSLPQELRHVVQVLGPGWRLRSDARFGPLLRLWLWVRTR